MNTNNDPTAVGVFDDLDKAERTVDELRNAGFSSEEIGIIGHVGADQPVPVPPQLNAPETNAMDGFVKGAVLGGIVGFLVILVIPGLGEVAGLGRWFEFIGGAALGATAAGVMVAYAGFMFTRSKTGQLAEELERGNFIVTVKNPGRKEEAEIVLRRRGINGEDHRQ